MITMRARRRMRPMSPATGPRDGDHPTPGRGASPHRIGSLFRLVIAAGLVPRAPAGRLRPMVAAAPAARRDRRRRLPSTTDGAAASVDPLATETAIEILRKGGNAVDAAVAAAGVLGVVEPFSCGIGGGFMVIYRASDGLVTTIDSRARRLPPPSPRRASSTRRPASRFPSPRRWPARLGVGVPGTLRGWQLALDRYGTMRPRDCSRGQGDRGERLRRRPDGLPTSSHRTLLVRGLHVHEAALPPRRRRRPSARSSGIPSSPRRTARSAAGPTFYSGKLARAIVDTVRNPPVVPGSTQGNTARIMTVGDLGAYPGDRADARTSDTAASTSTAWGRPRAAARPSARR